MCDSTIIESVNFETIKAKFDANNIKYETVEFKGGKIIDNQYYLIYESENYIVKVKDVIISEVIKNDPELNEGLNIIASKFKDERTKNILISGIEKRAWEKICEHYIIITDKQKKAENKIKEEAYFENIKKQQKDNKNKCNNKHRNKKVQPYKPINYKIYINANTQRNDYINISHPFTKKQTGASQFVGFLDAGFLLLQQISNNILKLEVDHKDRDKYNNNVVNLRVVSDSDNKKNKGPYNNYNLLTAIYGKYYVDNVINKCCLTSEDETTETYYSD